MGKKIDTQELKNRIVVRVKNLKKKHIILQEQIRGRGGQLDKETVKKIKDYLIKIHDETLEFITEETEVKKPFSLRLGGLLKRAGRSFGG